MKVGTDGVLLGAWADTNGCSTILDIGSGSGLIALMLAQRNLQASIEAVEIDKMAYEETLYNFQSSPWSSRLKAHHTDIKDYRTTIKYDLIVSNPPYFQAGTQSPNNQRHLARHHDSLLTTDLLTAVSRLLTKNGRVCLILPPLEGNELIEMAKTYGLYLAKQTTFLARVEKKPERLLIELSTNPTEPTLQTLWHYEADGSWSEAYKALTKDYHLML